MKLRNRVGRKTLNKTWVGGLKGFPRMWHEKANYPVNLVGLNRLKSKDDHCCMPGKFEKNLEILHGL